MSAPRPAIGELTLVGHPFAPIGMGEHVRSTWRALKAAGLHTPIVDIHAMDRRADPDLEREFAGAVAPGLSRGLNLFCINADEVGEAMKRLDQGAFEAAYNIVYPAWELARYPEPWARVLERFDEVWAPSRFIGEAVAPVVDRPVTHMPLAVELKLSSFLGRRWFAIPEHALVYLFFFDFSSFAQRKNPWAMLEAFERLAARRPEAPLHCVIKFKGGTDDHPGRRELDARLARLGDRAQAIRHDLTDNEIKNLVRCADAFVSLHRSEGFGRGMAEAMAMGRVAIATGYSGNLDFMTPDTSLLVDHTLVPVGADDYPHGDGQVWADASVDHAVTLMEWVLDHAAEARALGERARRHIRTGFSARAVGLRYLERLEAVCGS